MATHLQYAIPAQPQASQRSYGLTYAEHELLRQRKTPHGKVFEEHDASSLDFNAEAPAAKHLLLSSSPGFDRTNVAPYSLPHTQLFNREANIGLPDDASRGINQPQLGPQAYPPAWEFPGGLESVLNQTLPLHPSQRYYYQQGSLIPIVLPTALNNRLGPPVSVGQKHYGPYWPDGTFNPYRPASMRDDRFFRRPPNNPDQAMPRAQDADDTRTLRRSSKIQSLSSDLARPPYGLNEPHAVDQAPLTAFNATSPSRLSTFPYDGSLGYTQSSYSGWPKPPKSLAAPHQTYTPKVPTFSFKAGSASEQLAFRDRTFSWANNIYVALLGEIQRRNKASGQLPKATGTSTSKPQIYPRPPQRTGSHFSDHLVPNISSTSSHHCSQKAQRLENDASSRPSTAIYDPRRRVSDNERWPDTRGNSSAGNYMSNDPSRRISDSTGYQSWIQSQTVEDSAESALHTLEAFCDEAEFPWVDGMLLAGCLAYGLEKYDKALLWYQKILKQDMHHVEAMSNLAATLLALNRRDEAMSHWSAAVKLRPGYFEAVEHLIGLLCQSHRTKEALNVIEFVESALKTGQDKPTDTLSDGESDVHSRSSLASMASIERPYFDFDGEGHSGNEILAPETIAPGFASSGYSIPGAENGRILALIHAKGNLLYALQDNQGAASAFEDAILVATGQRRWGIRGLINAILTACLRALSGSHARRDIDDPDPLLLSPEGAETTAKYMFPPHGDLPGLELVPPGIPRKAAVATTSNSLLSLAKIYQDNMSNPATVSSMRASGTRDILALYYLSLSLQRSPSTANNVGILLAGVQTVQPRHLVDGSSQSLAIPGVVPGSGIALALAYYNYGLNLDKKHAHLYTNLGSLLKDIGQLNAAVQMYERAVSCDGKFDIALANLANAVKDQGRVAHAINYYRRAVHANPDFAEAVCGLATALNSVCNWHGRGGVYAAGGTRDKIHVDEQGMMRASSRSFGWMNRVVEIVDKQLKDGEYWGSGTLTPSVITALGQELLASVSHGDQRRLLSRQLQKVLSQWFGRKWEGSRIVRLIEKAIQRATWQWYQDLYIQHKSYPSSRYQRPQLPVTLSSPTAPTVLPFHTFTAPLSPHQIRQISQRNALRISVSTLRSQWLPQNVYPPPPPPNPYLIVGYVSSDFNNHPLAHLMQSVFGLHDTSSVKAICYATTTSDGSTHRTQIEQEAPVFHDASSWSVERLVQQIIKDHCHILINLNGYTRGARNEVFAARPAPLHMSFMGFAGTLGAEWCDYVFADSISIPDSTLAPNRDNTDISSKLHPLAHSEDADDWIYAENIIFARATFFCVDHKQSAPDAHLGPPPSSISSPRLFRVAWTRELDRRWALRKAIFPNLAPTAVILGNFNQLYKIDPSTYRIWLRILSKVPNAILWLLRFPDLGEQNLLSYARSWAGHEVASRVVFTDVALKGQHILRASVVDLFLDTPECNAHTTAADVVWSGTPIITWGRWGYKMCSRMAGSILSSALPEGPEGDEARRELVVNSEEEYEEMAIKLARGLKYPNTTAMGVPGTTRGLAAIPAAAGDRIVPVDVVEGHGEGRLLELRQMLWEGRWTSRLFDTKRWVRDLEEAYWLAWDKWVRGEGGDIYL